MKKNIRSKAFTLIELLAVIIILGILVLIATPAITEYINNSKKNTFLTTAHQYISAVRTKINELELPINSADEVYYIPIKCIDIERGSNPYGKWDSAYVVVTLDANNYYYYFAGRSENGYGTLLTHEDLLTKDYVRPDTMTIDTKVGIGERNTISVLEDDCNTINKVKLRSYISEKSTLYGDVFKKGIDDKKEYEEAYKNAVITDNSCFAFNKTTGAITNYYSHEGNDINNPECSKDVVIPRVIDDKTVTEIAASAFKNKGLTSLLLADTIVKIGASAFGYNNLTKLTLPSSVMTIGNESFRYTNKLTEVRILGKNQTADFTSYGNYIFTWETGHNDAKSIIWDFMECIAFNMGTKTIGAYYETERSHPEGEACPKDVIIPDQIMGINVEAIGANAFEGKNITSVKLPTHLKTISNYAFRTNKLTSLTIPNGVTSIGYAAFGYNNLTTLTIPSSVMTIGNEAFRYTNKLTRVEMQGKNSSADFTSYGSNMFTWDTGHDNAKSIIWESTTCFNFNPANKTIGKYYDNEKNNSSNPACPKDVVIPDQIMGINVEAIGANAFEGKNITSVKLPTHLKTISNYAFRTNKLTSLTIPNGVTSIGYAAFGYNNLTTLTIPSSVMTLGNEVFRYTNKLTRVEMIGKNSSADFTSYGSYMFTWDTGHSDAKSIIWNP